MTPSSSESNLHPTPSGPTTPKPQKLFHSGLAIPPNSKNPVSWHIMAHAISALILNVCPHFIYNGASLLAQFTFDDPLISNILTSCSVLTSIYPTILMLLVITVSPPVELVLPELVPST